MRVLVAGGTGALGREVVARLRSRHDVRRLSRRERSGADVVRGDLSRPESLRGVCDGVDVVFSCAGAPVLPFWRVPETTFARTDEAGNRALVDEAVRAGVRRFVYVSVAGAEPLAHLEYVRAHESVVAYAKGQALALGVVRPTGFFSSLAFLVDAARWGIVPVVGDGSAVTNPIHEADLADVCVEVVEADGALEVEVGGPEELTRRAISELALAAVSSARRGGLRGAVSVPALLPRLQAPLIGVVNPRIGHLLRFFVAVTTTDCVAPRRGERRLGDFFEQLASGSG